jgi:hydroxymethylbilane synthase
MSAIRVGTRASLLATTQTRWFTSALQELNPQLEIVEVLIKTEGDGTTTPLSESKNPGVFVSALRDALLANEVDFIVHSMKDLPAAAMPSIVTACVPVREDPRDALVSKHNETLEQLSQGARVGTSSPRRAGALKRLRPDLRVESIRGNVDSRITKVRAGDYDATLLALAGLNRIGRSYEAAEILGLNFLVPAPGQGALAVECRAEDQELADLLSQLDHWETRLTTSAEREVLVGLEAGCATAIGATASYDGSSLKLVAELAVESTGESVSSSRTALVSPTDLAGARALGLECAKDLLGSDLAKRAAFK